MAPARPSTAEAIRSAIARQRGDTASLARLAPLFEEFGQREGVIAVAAEAAQNWMYAGDETRARRLLHQLAGGDFAGIARGVDWMHTLARLTEVAAQLGERDLVTAAQVQLIPAESMLDGATLKEMPRRNF